MRKALGVFLAGGLIFGLLTAAADAQGSKVSLEGLEPLAGFAAVIDGADEQVMVNPEDKTIVVVRLVDDMTPKMWNSIVEDGQKAGAYARELVSGELTSHSVAVMEGVPFVDAYFKRENGVTNRMAAAYAGGRVCTVTVQAAAAEDLETADALIRRVFENLDIL